MNLVIRHHHVVEYLKIQKWIKNIYMHVQQWQQNARTRHQLTDLPDHLLKDIGMSPREADIEAHRPFWD